MTIILMTTQVFRLKDLKNRRMGEELSDKFHDEIIKYEEGKQMPYITTAERIGIEKGIEKGEKMGIKKGMLNIAKTMLKMEMGFDMISKATGLKKEEIKKLGETGNQ